MPETDKSKSKIGLLILLASVVISLAMLLLAAQRTSAALPGGSLSKVNSYPPEKPQATITGTTTLTVTETATLTAVTTSTATLTSTSMPIATATKTATATPACTPGFEIVTSPNPTSSDSYLADVSALADDNVWAVGYYTSTGEYRTLIEHWDGAIWSVITSPNPGTGSTLSGISAVSSNDIWAAGSYASNSSGYTLIEHWDGASWNVVSSPNQGTSSALSGISAVSSNDIWAVGNYDMGVSQTLTSIGMAQPWSVVPSNLTSGDGAYLRQCPPTQRMMCGLWGARYSRSQPSLWHLRGDRALGRQSLGLHRLWLLRRT